MGYNFLVVDDSSIVRKVILRTIGMTNIDVSNVIEAENGKIALEQLRTHWVDLVFLDINMPVMNGMEFMELLREDPLLKDTPVVVVSTEGSQERMARLAELGTRAYLRKPVTPETLTEAVSEVLTHIKKREG
jgi:two-component system, chemotaxis family, chemotaxis protein CheY